MYNLNDYETVKSRKERFYKDNVDGRIVVENITPIENLMDFALFKATIYKNKEEQEKMLMWSTGYAMEIRDKEMKQGKSGAYESVNFSSWTENCEESCCGRALDNAGYSGNKKCSQEEMEQSEKNKNVLQNVKSTTQTNCEKCGASLILNPKTSRMFCEKKCWLNKPIQKENIPF
jgi:hypothetical protein